MPSRKPLKDTILQTLAAQIGGTIQGDELYYPSFNPEIFISTEDGSEFYLASQTPLYSLKHGKPRRARRGTKDEDIGWYYVTASPDQLRQVLDLALSHADPEAVALQFAYECVLRDYCVDHLSDIEPGLRLYRDGGVRGVELSTGSGYIDILATDIAGALVVVELKLSRGHRAVVGQLADYIGWAKDHFKPKRPVRGIIIAPTISEELRRAASIIPNVSLATYKLGITITKV